MAEKPQEEKKVDASRRATIAAIGGLAVGGVLGYLLAPRAPPETVTRTVPTTTTVPVTTTVTQTVTATPPAPPPQPVAKYPRAKLANISELQPKRPVTKQYVGVNVWVVKLGERAVGGVGPDGDVVAFANLCTHMGGPLVYNPQNNCAVCQIHYTQFDLARGGKMVTGHSTEHLPQVMLEFDERTGDIYAVGINQLVYGKLSNL
jgi:arsenite oxidase, small subunit